MKKVAALLLAVLLLFLTACSGDGENAEEALADPPASADEISEEGEPDGETEGEGGETGEIAVVVDSSVVSDPFELKGAMAVDIRLADDAPDVQRAELVGRMIYGQSSKTLGSDIISADYYAGNWALVIDGVAGEGDIIQLVEGVNRKVAYQCGDVYPRIASVCINVNGVQWIEYNDTHWRMRQILPGGQAVRLLRESETSAKGVPVAVSRDDSLMLLYDTADGAALLRAWNDENGRWREERESVRTIQNEAPQSVEDWATWIELTSKGWAAVSRNFVTEEKEIFILPGRTKPTAATYDGKLLIFLVEGYLYVYDYEHDRTSFVAGEVSDYRHVPRSGAVFSSTHKTYAAMRFEMGDVDEDGVYLPGILYPLARNIEGGEIVKVFFSGGDVDTATFLIERDGMLEQTTVLMQSAE